MELLGELGRGARSVVYRARRRESPSGEEYAVKLLRSLGDASEAAAFRREAALLASLDHPGLVRIHEVGQVGDRPYLIMDLIQGQSLASVLAQGPLSEDRAVELAAAVADPLAVAHRAGLVHRDVKPANIMISRDGRASLIDFGLATRVGETVHDDVVGTFMYSAPEQVGMLRRPVDGRADLYGLGVVLFECLTGEVPFVADDVGELMHLHATVPAPDVTTLRSEVSPAIAAIVGKLLAKDPDDRYQSGAGLRSDLARITAGERDPFPLGTGDTFGAEPDLVGRHPELAQLAARWERAVAGRGGVALVQGPSGSGKTRLVSHFTAGIRATGRLVLHGRCEADRAVPLAPLRAAVDGYVQTVRQLPEPARSAALERLRSTVVDVSGLLRPLSAALAELVDAPDTAEHDNQQQFAGAVAEWLVRLADVEGGVLLHLDDLSWCDDATRRVLRELGPASAQSRLLIVATADDDTGSRPALDTVLDALEPACDLRVSVGPLDEPAIAALVTGQLGPLEVPSELVARLVTRSGGSPLAVLEYVRAVTDAGLLRPSWGAWLLDAAGLDQLPLPDDVMTLVLCRVEMLGSEARGLLTVAAAMGSRFDASAAARVRGLGPPAASTAVIDATGYHLIEPAEGGGHVFLHDRIREALLGDLSEAEVRRLHQHIAEDLEHDGGADAAHTYALARHYLAGETDRTPDRVYRAVAAAGSLALAEHSATDAIRYFAQAETVSAAAGLAPDAAFRTDFGVAASRAGQYGLAHQQLGHALDAERDRVRRADLYRHLANTHYLRWEGEHGLDMVQRGLAELGRRSPQNLFALIVVTLAYFVAGGLMRRLPHRLRLVTGEARRRMRLQASLTHFGMYGAGITMRQALLVCWGLQSRYLAARLGSGPEYAEAECGLAIVAAGFGMRRTADRLLRRAAEAATMVGDPRLAGKVSWLTAVARDLVPPMCGRSGTDVLRTLQQHGRWLDTTDYITAIGALGYIKMARGYADDMREWCRHAEARAHAVGEALNNVAELGAQAAALAGQPAEAAARLRQARELFAATAGNIAQAMNVAITALVVAVEQGEVGEVFDEAAAECAALRLKPATVWSHDRMYWVYLAFGRLAQAAAEPPEQRAARLATATHAVVALRRAAAGPVLRGYQRAAEASLRQLRGDHVGALRRLGRLDVRIGGLDLPLLGFEVARVRARAYRALGAEADARRQAGFALMLADDHGWQTRARWIRTEFDLEPMRPSVASSGGRRASKSMRSDGVGGLHQRHLSALHQVSIAAATVLDPDQLARVALDEILNIFAAERAFLFLVDQDGGELRPYLGRDNTGANLEQLVGYGSTLVQRAHDTGEALVITGSEEGAALGSRSTVIHKLRSIMVAPLQLKGRVLGVVYLDSRAAKGVFTADDVEMLTALINHIALSLETARAAQLELAVHTAQDQRDLAERLHGAMTEMSATLDPDEVVRRLLAVISRLVPARTAVLLHRVRSGEEITISPTPQVAVDLDSDAVLVRLLAAETPQHGWTADAPGPLHTLIDSTGWLAVPLLVRDEHRGLLLTGIDSAPTDAQINIAAAVAGQGMAALDNALLFRQIEHTAAHDGLTGLYNRHRFTDVASHELETAATTTAIMVDIDHFKTVNDTHGHAVGDKVIIEVANRLANALRKHDIICRYGGEEFAILLPGADTAEGERVARRLHAAVSTEPMLTTSGALQVTVSVGVVNSEVPTTDLGTMLRHADEALYAAKRAGRNRVIMAAPVG